MPQATPTRYDPLTPKERSERMSRVRSKDTSPEMALRRRLHSLGLRYRLHRKDLPGSPDLVFPAKRKVVFVHGCFWHRHLGCGRTRMPRTRQEFWRKKFKENVDRDARNQRALEALGWTSLVVWECEIASGDAGRAVEKVVEFLEPGGPTR